MNIRERRTDMGMKERVFSINRKIPIRLSPQYGTVYGSANQDLVLALPALLYQTAKEHPNARLTIKVSADYDETAYNITIEGEEMVANDYGNAITLEPCVYGKENEKWQN